MPKRPIKRSTYLARIRGRIAVRVPLQCFGSKMSFGRFFHFLASALNIFFLQVLFTVEPIILVPANEKPDVLFAIHLIFVDLAENLSGGLGVKKADYNASVLSLQIGHGSLWVAQKTLARGNGDVGQLGARFQVIQGLLIKKAKYLL